MLQMQIHVEQRTEVMEINQDLETTMLQYGKLFLF